MRSTYAAIRPSVLCLFPLAACGTVVHRSVDIHDAGVVMPAVRVASAGCDFGREKQWHWRFAGDFARAAGSVAGGRASYEILEAHGAFRLETPWTGEPSWLPWSTRGARLAVSGGPDFLVMNVRDERLVPTVHEGRGSLGMLGTIELTQDLGAAELYGRFSHGYLFEATENGRIEVGLQSRLGCNVQGFVGYRWWSIDREREQSEPFGSGDGYETDFDVDTQGVVLGLAVQF